MLLAAQPVCMTGLGHDCVPLAQIASIVGGKRHTCTVDVDGRAWCWGDNERGQLGDGTTLTRSNATPVCASGAGPGCTQLSGVVALAAGQRHTCALRDDSSMMCWGYNGDGAA